MNAIDLILSLLDSLTPQEKKQVADGLKLQPPKLEPCEKNGHKFKLVSNIPGGWFRRRHAVLHCEKCGKTDKTPY